MKIIRVKDRKALVDMHEVLVAQCYLVVERSSAVLDAYDKKTGLLKKRVATWGATLSEEDDE